MLLHISRDLQSSSWRMCFCCPKKRKRKKQKGEKGKKGKRSLLKACCKIFCIMCANSSTDWLHCLSVCLTLYPSLPLSLFFSVCVFCVFAGKVFAAHANEMENTWAKTLSCRQAAGTVILWVCVCVQGVCVGYRVCVCVKFAWFELPAENVASKLFDYVKIALKQCSMGRGRGRLVRVRRGLKGVWRGYEGVWGF